MKVHLSEVVELRGEAWDEKRLKMLKDMNPEGRVAVTDENGQIFVVPIKTLEALSD